jgi:hypothetical protein
MKRVITIKNVYGTDEKYVLRDEYEGFGIYQEKCPTGYFVSQSWLISNNDNAELVIESYNSLCKEEVLDIIDHYNEKRRFGVKALMHCGSLHMHNGGQFV